MRTVGFLIISCLILALTACQGRPEEHIKEFNGAAFKVTLRTREYNKSAIQNVEVCAARLDDKEFPSDDGQCFLRGYDFSNLEISWLSPQEAQISFACGRVSSFRNFALVREAGGGMAQVHAKLVDHCSETKH